MKKIIFILSLFILSVEVFAQNVQGDTLAVTFSKEYLDTVKLKRKFLMNDYSSIGIEYGVSLNRVSFTPTTPQSMLLSSRNIGVTYTRYGKMFGYMPYFGFQVGLFYGQDGYKTKQNKESEVRPTVDGAYQAIFDYVEVPLLAIFHMDVLKFRIMADLGIYGGYRLSVDRMGDDSFNPDYKDKFYDYEIRTDYGLKGGGGFALLFDPFEFFVRAQIKYSWSSLCKSDYKSEYYSNYAYPFDIVISAGIQFQLSKRTGKTKAQLRKEAREMVYNTNNE